MQQIKVLSFKKTNFIENTSHFIKYITFYK